MIAAFCAILLVTAANAAEDCQKLEFGAREALVRKALTCDKTMEQFTNCNAGGSGDVILGQIVTEKCQGDFLKKLNAKQRQAYADGIKSCNAEVKGDEGTLSRAMAAGCRAELARSYARKFGRARQR